MSNVYSLEEERYRQWAKQFVDIEEEHGLRAAHEYYKDNIGEEHQNRLAPHITNERIRRAREKSSKE